MSLVHLEGTVSSSSFLLLLLLSAGRGYQSSTPVGVSNKSSVDWIMGAGLLTFRLLWVNRNRISVRKLQQDMSRQRPQTRDHPAAGTSVVDFRVDVAEHLP